MLEVRRVLKFLLDVKNVPRDFRVISVWSNKTHRGIDPYLGRFLLLGMDVLNLQLVSKLTGRN